MKYFWLTIQKMFRFLLKPLSFVPALCVMYMIFSFSAQTADESGQLSMLVSETVVLLLGKLTSGNLDTAQVGVYVCLLYTSRAAAVLERILKETPAPAPEKG